MSRKFKSVAIIGMGWNVFQIEGIINWKFHEAWDMLSLMLSIVRGEGHDLAFPIYEKTWRKHYATKNGREKEEKVQKQEEQ